VQGGDDVSRLASGGHDPQTEGLESRLLNSDDLWPRLHIIEDELAVLPRGCVGCVAGRQVRQSNGCVGNGGSRRVNDLSLDDGGVLGTACGGKQTAAYEDESEYDFAHDTWSPSVRGFCKQSADPNRSALASHGEGEPQDGTTEKTYNPLRNARSSHRSRT
jgi:hypothetical protein